MAAEKSEKMTQKELKQPDAFQRAGAEAREWLIERQKLVAIGAGVLLLGGLGAALASYFSGRSEAKASQELGQVLDILERPVMDVQGAELTPPPGEKPPFKTKQEQDQALVKGLTDFRNTYKGTRAATTAALPLGKAEYRLGNHDAALAAFDEYLKSASEGDPLRAGALEGRGYAYEAQGKYDQALAAFDQLAKENTGGYLAGMGQYHRARVLILQGQKEQAAQVLSEVPTAHANTAAARLASERLALLAAEGVKVPTPAPAAASAQDAG